MYHIYTTEGIVLKSLPSSEANKSFWILSKDLGLLIASAQGVRLSKSKLRFSLTDFSHISLSVVYGRGGWRIVSARPLDNFYALSRENIVKLRVLVSISKLILRLIQGQEQDKALYGYILETFQGIEVLEIEEEVRDWEILRVHGILAHLGYVHSSSVAEPYRILDAVVRRKYIEEINQALKASHL